MSQKVVDDILGKKVGSTYIEGLVDAQDECDFYSKLVVQSWRSSAVSSVSDLEGYFTVYKAKVLCNTMLRYVREECGLGCPPDIFTTNASESVNAVLKHKVNYKQNELPQFIDKLREVFREQQQEVQCAVLGRGKYQFREQYCYLEVPESKWFMMNIEQRKKHLSKVNSASLVETDEACSYALPHIPSSSSESTTQHCPESSLSVDFDSAATQVSIPSQCLQGIWTKASQLIKDKSAIVPAPGQEPEAKMVLSYSGKCLI